MRQDACRKELETMKVTKLDGNPYEKVTIEIKMRWTPLIRPMIAVLQNRDAPKSSHAEITNEFLRLAGVADALADAREVEG